MQPPFFSSTLGEKEVGLMILFSLTLEKQMEVQVTQQSS